jgi:hypothetical protein
VRGVIGIEKSEEIVRFPFLLQRGGRKYLIAIIVRFPFLLLARRGAVLRHVLRVQRGAREPVRFLAVPALAGVHACHEGALEEDGDFSASAGARASVGFFSIAVGSAAAGTSAMGAGGAAIAESGDTDGSKFRDT